MRITNYQICFEVYHGTGGCSFAVVDKTLAKCQKALL